MKKASLKSVCQPSEDIVAREIEGDMIIVPLVPGIGDSDDDLYTLNETGKAIWQKLNGKVTLGQVSEELTEKFSSPASEIGIDVVGFVNEMIRLGMLTVK